MRLYLHANARPYVTLRTPRFSILTLIFNFQIVNVRWFDRAKLGGSIFHHNKNSAAPCQCALVLICRRRIQEPFPPRALPTHERKKQAACASLKMMFNLAERKHKEHSSLRGGYCFGVCSSNTNAMQVRCSATAPPGRLLYAVRPGFC